MEYIDGRKNIVMPMRILVITNPIEPPSYAPRVMTMCHYLQEAGHDVILESGELTRRSRLQWIGDKLWGQDDRTFGKRLLRKYSREHFDVILCSTYYYFPLQTAAQLSKAWGIPFVVDFRDIVEQWGTKPYFTTKLPHLLGLENVFARWYERKNISMRNRMMDRAKAVTTVSPWHQQYLQSLTDTPVHLIYNGYDEEEIGFEKRKTTTFSIAYIGRIMSLTLRQPQMLFEAVSEMIKDGEIEDGQWRMDFYAEAEKEAEVRELARMYGIATSIKWHKFVSRSELNGIMAESSVLLVLGCPPEARQHGILGTKVYEAIGVEKPLLLVPSDEDSLAELIRETGIGIAARDKEEVKTFLRQKYQEWKQKGYTRQSIADKERFSRKREAYQMGEILTKYDS